MHVVSVPCLIATSLGSKILIEPPEGILVATIPEIYRVALVAPTIEGSQLTWAPMMVPPWALMIDIPKKVRTRISSFI